ncbi:MAG: LysE family transporter [Pelotomaculum sp.]|nr:LysE family transporter [Pelotomaculum sp.]
MELAMIFSTAFVVGFSGAMMPGPLLTVTVGESARRGFVAGPLLVLGHGILELALILALAGGLSSFFKKTGVSHTVAVLGGAFLIYMGYGMARDAFYKRVSLAAAGPAGEACGNPGGAGVEKEALKGAGGVRLHPVLAGVLTSVSNPYWTLWWATVGLGYITLSLRSGFAGLASFFTGHILADLVWYSLIAAAVAGGRKFLKEGVYRGVLVVCGVFLIGLGGYFLYFGLFT